MAHHFNTVINMVHKNTITASGQHGLKWKRAKAVPDDEPGLRLPKRLAAGPGAALAAASSPLEQDSRSTSSDPSGDPSGDGFAGVDIHAKTARKYSGGDLDSTSGCLHSVCWLDTCVRDVNLGALERACRQTNGFLQRTLHFVGATQLYARTTGTFAFAAHTVCSQKSCSSNGHPSRLCGFFVQHHQSRCRLRCRLRCRQSPPPRRNDTHAELVPVLQDKRIHKQIPHKRSTGQATRVPQLAWNENCARD